MINRLLFLIILMTLLQIFSISTQAQSEYKSQWAIGMGGVAIDLSEDVVVDSLGNVYVVGYFASPNADFDPGPNNAILNAQGMNAYLAKYNKDGEYVWAKKLGASGTLHGRSIVIDNAGYLYITGALWGRTNFNAPSGTNTQSKGESDIFLLKYDTSGNFIWSRSTGGKLSDYAYEMAIDSDNNVYLIGEFSDTVDFSWNNGTGILISSGESDGFLAKYDTSGNYLWATSFGSSTGSETARGITIDNAGNIYVSGSFTQNAQVKSTSGNTTTISSSGGFDIYLIKYSSSGLTQWAKAIGGTGNESSLSLDVNDQGVVCVSGTFNGTTDFDPDTANATMTALSLTGSDAFVAAYDTSGKYLWAKGIGGTQLTTGYNVLFDRVGNIFFAGYFDSDTIKISDTNLELYGAGSSDIFLAKFDHEGNTEWAKSIGGNQDDQALGLNKDHLGNLYLNGIFSTTVNLDSAENDFVLTSKGLMDIFILKMSCNDTSLSNIVIEDCGNEFLYNGKVYYESATDTFNLFSGNGCDSTVILDIKLYDMQKAVINVSGFVLGVSASYQTYQWVIDGKIIEGAIHSTYTVLENGNYQVYVSNENGCYDTSDVYIINNVFVNEHYSSEQISIYPNPTKDIIHIKSSQQLNVSVFNMHGQEIEQLSNPQTINSKHWATGIYWLKLCNINGSLLKVEKIVKQ